jgi:hypothetical protein
MESDDPVENKAGGLCCYHAGTTEAMEILNRRPDLKQQIATGKLTWNNLKK